jgi:hypothetical protein
MQKLVGLGFWAEHFNPGRFPNPRRLVQQGWEQGSLDRIVEYLRSGKVLMDYVGYSFCRFECGIPSSKMGCADLTDGAFVWPDGLAHYVEMHSVILPEFFVEHMRMNSFRIGKDAGCLPFDSSYSVQEWIDWASAKRAIEFPVEVQRPAPPPPSAPSGGQE